MSRSSESELRKNIGAALGEPRRIGLSVAHLSAATELLSRLLGVGSWEHSQWPPPDRNDLRSFHRGRPSDDWTAKMACAQVGPIELELVEHTGGESSYGEFIDRVGTGLHHLMFMVDDVPSVAARFAQEDIAISTSVGIGADVRWAVLDTHAVLGFNIEIKARQGFS